MSPEEKKIRNRKYAKEFRLKNPARAREIQKKVYVKNRKKILKREKEYRIANPERRAEIKHRSYQKNKEKNRVKLAPHRAEINARSRAMRRFNKFKNSNKLTKTQEKEMLNWIKSTYPSRKII